MKWPGEKSFGDLPGTRKVYKDAQRRSLKLGPRETGPDEQRDAPFRLMTNSREGWLSAGGRSWLTCFLSTIVLDFVEIMGESVIAVDGMAPNGYRCCGCPGRMVDLI
jgi:hypothetical protein